MSEFTLRQLQYFESVVGHGSLSAAAEQCHVTPSALTLAIDDLERHLNVQLLVRRKGRGVVLTPAGSRVLAHVRNVLGHAESLAEEASRVAHTVSGRLSVGCFTTLTPFFAPSITEKFERDYPAVDLELLAAPALDLHEQLLQGRLDLAVLYSIDVPASLDFDPVLEYQPHVLVAAGHPLANRREISLGELASDKLVLLDAPPSRANTLAIFDSLSLTAQIGHVSSSYETVRCLVGHGLGYAVLFQKPATDITYDGHTVRALRVIDRVPPTVVGLARPHGGPRNARYDALREHLVRSGMRGEPITGAPRAAGQQDQPSASTVETRKAR